jgi:hypothetical protein
MRRLLLLVAALFLAVPAVAQDYQDYPPAEPQGTGYGTVTFINQTAFQVDFYIDSSYACRAWANSSCSAQATVGNHYVSGKPVEAGASEVTGSLEVYDGGESSWTISGGGTPNSGADTPAGTGYGTIEFKNYTVFQIDFYIDGVYGCRAELNSSCSAQASVGSHYISARTVEATPRESTSSGVEVVDGGTTTIEYTGGGNAPTGYGMIEIKNYSAFQLDAYSDGVYLCRAEPSSSCSGQATVGSHSVMVRTVEATPRESPATAVEVVEGGTSTVEYSGGGNAPTGYGTIEVLNNTAFQVDAYVDGTYFCRAEASSSCSAQASVGTHSVTVRTVEDTPRESSPASVEVVDGGTSSIEFNGGGDAPTGYGKIEFVNGTALTVDFYIDLGLACRASSQGTCTAETRVGTHSVTARTVEDTPRESEPSNIEVADGATTRFEIGGGGEAVTAPETGTVVFENYSTYYVDFLIDGATACRATPVSTCTAEATAGRRAVKARTLSDPPYMLEGFVDVTAGAIARYAIGNAANAQPAR